MQTVLHFNGQVVLKIHYRFLVSKIPKAKQLWADLSLHPKPPQCDFLQGSSGSAGFKSKPLTLGSLLGQHVLIIGCPRDSHGARLIPHPTAS